MDISGLSNSQITQTSFGLQTEISQTERMKQLLENASESGVDTELKDACESFEAYFLNMVFKEMRKTSTSDSGVFEKSSATKIYEDMFDEQISKQAATSGGVGLADFMYRQMSQENAISIEDIRNKSENIVTEIE